MMPISKVSSREFNQHTSRAKSAARSGPVIITERGRPAHVLLTFEEYQRLAGSKGSIVERLGLPAGIEDVELEIPPLRDPGRPADLR
jgi:prevent-host-death family protein